MKVLPLGNSVLHSSQLAYGCWRIATARDPATHLSTARRAVHAAVEAGYTLFDHADIYCDGRAETVFGELLRESPGLREKIVIATKCGIRFVDQPKAGAPYRYDFSAEYITQQCEQSLRRLGIECIDLYQLHRPDWLMNAEEVAGAFDKLQRAGKVQEFGVSNFSPSQFKLLQQACKRPLVVNQVEISLAQLATFFDGTLDQCQELKVTPLAWSPLGGGLLGDGGKDLLPAQQFYRPEKVVKVLDTIAAARGVSRMVVALAWLLRHPAGIVPIVGSTDPGRIQAAVAATENELTREEWYRLFTAARGEPLP
jgi:predicted oxidoreductase